MNNKYNEILEILIYINLYILILNSHKTKQNNIIFIAKIKKPI